MKQVSTHRSGEQGVALIVAVIFLIVMGMSAAYIMTRVVTHSNQVNHHIDQTEAFQALEAATAQSVSEIALASDAGVPADEKDGFIGIDPNYDFAVLGLPGFGSPGVAPVTMDSNQELQFFAYYLDWASDGLDNNGDTLIDDLLESTGFTSFVAHARVIRNGQTLVAKRTEQIMGAGPAISVWQNAIFAGNGQGGALINGNVSIHGSVHLLGANLDSNDPAITSLEALALGGTSLIHNNYDGIPADMAWRIPPLPKTLYNGELVDTIFAHLRVKQGMVSMNGNSEIGQQDLFGNDFKELMDAIYVTDGWTGNQVVDGDPLNVYSENGWENGYDLGEGIPYPSYQNDGGRVHMDYYLETNADPNVGLQHVFTGDMTIQPGSGNMYWNATTGDLVQGGTPGDGNMPNSADLNPDHYYVWFDDSSDTMMINGRIPIDGNLGLLAGNGAGNKTINYEGKGTFFTHDAAAGDGTGDTDVEISASLLTSGFPNTNLLGIHSEDDMVLGTDSQLSIMGGFYAQDTVTANKQTTIMGTIVGDYFDMGGQVPDIYQVPALENAWDDYMRMIGAEPTQIPQPLAWMEFNVL